MADDPSAIPAATVALWIDPNGLISRKKPHALMKHLHECSEWMRDRWLQWLRSAAYARNPPPAHPAGGRFRACSAAARNRGGFQAIFSCRPDSARAAEQAASEAPFHADFRAARLTMSVTSGGAAGCLLSCLHAVSIIPRHRSPPAPPPGYKQARAACAGIRAHADSGALSFAALLSRRLQVMHRHIPCRTRTGSLPRPRHLRKRHANWPAPSAGIRRTV